MYRNSYQRGMLTVFFSVGSKPLNIWETHTQDGYISRFLDQDIKSMVLEIRGTNISTTYMVCPKGKMVLGITMPFLVMIVKNLKKYFSFEVTILDETSTRRRFRISNFQSTTQILPMCTVMPIGLSDGWNQIQFNLAEFTRRAYKKQFIEVQKLKINANIRLRRIYFAERLIPEDQLPPEYKLYFPLANKGAKGKKALPPIQVQETAQVIEEKKEVPEEAKAEAPKVSPTPSVQAVKPPSQQGSQAKVGEDTGVVGSNQPSLKSIPAEVPGEGPPTDGGESEVTPITGGEATPDAVPQSESVPPEGDVTPEPESEAPAEAAADAPAEAPAETIAEAPAEAIAEAPPEEPPAPAE